MELTRSYSSQTDSGIRIHVKRISLSERLQFVQQSFELIQQLQFLTAQPNRNAQAAASIGQLEADLSKVILRSVWLGMETVDGKHQVNEELIQWLLAEAPADFCCEVVSLCSEQISLSDAQRKKSLPPSIT